MKWDDALWLLNHINDFTEAEKPTVYARIEELTGIAAAPKSNVGK